MTQYGLNDPSEEIFRFCMSLAKGALKKVGSTMQEFQKQFKSDALAKNVQWDVFREDSPKGTDLNAKTAWFSDTTKEKMLAEQQKMMHEGIIHQPIIEFVDVEDPVTGHKLSNWNVMSFDKTQWDNFLKLKQRAFGGKEIDAGEVRWQEPEKTDPQVLDAFNNYLNEVNAYGQNEVDQRNKMAMEKIASQGGDPSTYVKEKFKPIRATILKVPGTSIYDVVVDGNPKEVQKLLQRHAKDPNTQYQGVYDLDIDGAKDNQTLRINEHDIDGLVADDKRARGARTPKDDMVR